jgi:uncharacterized membrane protein YjgN (DUF898 family)
MDSIAENVTATPSLMLHGEAEAPAQSQVLAPTFTGSAKEYFRIWIVNLLLTVATLGIYSAWAKVRRLQYFYRNTQLAGASFDFHGDPKAILKGRLIAVTLFAGYHYAFGFSIMVGAAISAVLILGLPFLVRSALRFRLTNTSYRGLRFGFAGTVREAYRAYLPPVATVLLPGALLGIAPQNRTAMAASVLYLAWPTMHGLMKRYQLSNLIYANKQAQYDVSPSRFYAPYLRAGLLSVGAIVATVALALIVSALLEKFGPRGGKTTISWVPLVVGIATAYCFFLMAGPYLQVRINNLAWSNTSLPGVAIRSCMTARGMLRLQVANTLLTLLTLGLYRPFAVVRVYQYRLAHCTLETQGDFEHIVAGVAPPTASATGDGATEFLGVDISW